MTPFVCADTLTLRNNAEINGRVRYADSAFSVAARYSTGSSQTRTFDRKEVLTLEFNQRDLNPGPPPTDISVFAERKSDTKDAAHPIADTGKSEDSPNPNGTKRARGAFTTLASDDHSPSDDVIWLRNKKKLAGRLVKIESGKITVQSGKKRKSLDSGEVATVLISPY